MDRDNDPHSGATRLSARTLALTYASIIAYLSLNPFRGWQRPAQPFSFLFEPLPRYITDFDLFINVIAYVPLGFLATVYFLRRQRPLIALTIGTLLSGLLSFSLESAQEYLPHSRFASKVDLVCNVLGAVVGAALAEWLGRYRTLEVGIANLRRRYLLPGNGVDVGLALLLLWLVSQLNPSIAFLGSGWVQHVPNFPWQEWLGARPPSNWASQAVGIALNTCGLGLFVSLLMSNRVRSVIGALLLIAGAASLKALAANAMLRPGVELGWLVPGTSPGVAIGILLLLLTVRLNFRARIVLSSVAILSAALVGHLGTANARPRAIFYWYDWPHGQMLNFTGLTRTLNEAWPYLAILYLLMYFFRSAARAANSGARQSDSV